MQEIIVICGIIMILFVIKGFIMFIEIGDLYNVIVALAGTALIVIMSKGISI